VMALIFQGWGLGLFDRFDRFEQWGFLLLGCVLMLGWSKPWLAHFRFGPLEWLWRCATMLTFQIPFRKRGDATVPGAGTLNATRPETIQV